MSRMDNLWSQSVLCTVTAALACLRGASVTAAKIDLFYDPKSLTLNHRNACHETLRATLPDIAREDPETHEFLPIPTFHFGRIEQIPKCGGGARAGALQTGITLAHHLCCECKSLIRGAAPQRIVVRDHTNAVLSMISKFIGERGCPTQPKLAES